MGFPKTILFVCNANRRRSVTSELVFKNLLEKQGYMISHSPTEEGIYVSSAGVFADENDYNVTQMTVEIGDKADYIFTFNESIKARLVLQYKQNPEKIINLSVADVYEVGHPKLMSELEEKLLPYIDKLGFEKN